MKNNLSIKSVLSRIGSAETDEKGSKVPVEEVQKNLLLIYKDVYDACEKNGLRLFLQGGTLLGKVRHNGFIPWDDDMDLGMAREEYDRFIEIFDSVLGKEYALKAPGYKDGSDARFIHIYKKEPTEQFIDSDKTLCLDVFPIDYAPDNIVRRTLKGIKSNALMFIEGSKSFDDYCSPEMAASLKKSASGYINYYIRKTVAWVYRKKAIDSIQGKIDKAVCYKKKGKLCTSATGRWHYFGELQDSNVFFPLKRTDFCGIGAWTINQEEEYLRHNYGPDYMKIHPEHERERHF